MPRWRSSINTSEFFGAIERFRINLGDQDGLKVDTGKLHDVLEKYASSFEIHSELTPIEC